MLRIILISLALLAVAACSTSGAPYYTEMKTSDFSEVKNTIVIEINERLDFSEKSTSWVGRDIHEGLLPGRYSAALENDSGILFFGEGRRHFEHASGGQYYLRQGGIWVPKSKNLHPKIFFVIAPLGSILEPSLEAKAEVQKNTQDSFDLLAGQFPASTVSEGVGYGLGIGIVNAISSTSFGSILIYTPLNNNAYSEKLSTAVNSQLDDNK